MRWSLAMAIGGLLASCETVQYDIWTIDPSPGDPSPGDTSITPDTVIIVDNDDAQGYEEQGGWYDGSSEGYYGRGSRWAPGGQGDATATFTPTISKSGPYMVQAWWVSGDNRSANAEYRIVHLGGTTSVRRDQTVNGSKWNLLAIVELAAGTAGQVVLTDDAEADDVVSADAVRFTYVTTSEIIVDNSDEDFFSATENWNISTEVTGFWGDDYRRRASEEISDTAKWAAELPLDSRYEVFARWPADASHASQAAFIVFHAGGQTTVRVNQQTDGGTWISLGIFTMQGGLASRVQLSCWTTSGTYVVADAVRFVLLGE